MADITGYLILDNKVYKLNPPHFHYLLIIPLEKDLGPSF